MELKNKYTPCDLAWLSPSLRSGVFLRGQDTIITKKFRYQMDNALHSTLTVFFVVLGEWWHI